MVLQLKLHLLSDHCIVINIIHYFTWRGLWTSFENPIVYHLVKFTVLLIRLNIYGFIWVRLQQCSIISLSRAFIWLLCRPCPPLTLTRDLLLMTSQSKIKIISFVAIRSNLQNWTPARPVRDLLDSAWAMRSKLSDSMPSAYLLGHFHYPTWHQQ